MENKHNIENLMKSLKSGYKTPENYFDELESRLANGMKKERAKKRFLYSLSVAASVLLIFGMSIFFLMKKEDPYNQNKTGFSHPVSVNDDAFFDDIDEETIEEYLVDNGLMDEIYDETEININ